MENKIFFYKILNFSSEKKIIFLQIIFVLSIFFTTGCRSTKSLKYLDNTYEKELLTKIPGEQIKYKIKPGDILYISIKCMNNDLNFLFNPEEGMQVSSNFSYFEKFESQKQTSIYGYTVDIKGNITLPLIGEINVAGHFKHDIESVVKLRADQYLKNTVVKVKLLNYRVTVLGEVKTPGVYYNYNDNLTILDALAMANGNSDYSNLKDVTVMRAESKGKRIYHLNLTKKESLSSPAFFLQPNDYILVNPNRSKNIQLNYQIISLSLSSFGIIITALALIL